MTKRQNRLYEYVADLEARVARLEGVVFGGKVPVVQGVKASLERHMEQTCFPILKRTPNPDRVQLNRIVDDLLHPFPDMTRKELAQKVREFFRKRREYMNGRLDTAIRNHLANIKIESVEEAGTLLGFIAQNNGFTEYIQHKAQIDIEDVETARLFVSNRIRTYVQKWVQTCLADIHGKDNDSLAGKNPGMQWKASGAP